MRFLIIPLAILVLAGCSKPEPAANETAASADAGPVKGVSRDHAGESAPQASFLDPDGDETSLAEFRGAPVLVNLWATWCAPCVKELPTLDRIATAERKGSLKVVAISQDTGPNTSVAAFLKVHNVLALEPYQDPDMALSSALAVQVMPTTILFDASGREVWRYTGDLDWTGEEASRLLAQGVKDASER